VIDTDKYEKIHIMRRIKYIAMEVSEYTEKRSNAQLIRSFSLLVPAPSQEQSMFSMANDMDKNVHSSISQMFCAPSAATVLVLP